MNRRNFFNKIITLTPIVVVPKISYFFLRNNPLGSFWKLINGSQIDWAYGGPGSKWGSLTFFNGVPIELDPYIGRNEIWFVNRPIEISSRNMRIPSSFESAIDISKVGSPHHRGVIDSP